MDTELTFVKGILDSMGGDQVSSHNDTVNTAWKKILLNLGGQPNIIDTTPSLCRKVLTALGGTVHWMDSEHDVLKKILILVGGQYQFLDGKWHILRKLRDTGLSVGPTYDPTITAYDSALVTNGFAPTTATAKTWYQGLFDIMDAHSISRTGATAGMYLDGYTPGSGATAFSILGGNGTLLNGPTWVENGININGNGLEIRYNVGPVTGSGSVLVMRQNTNGVESPFDAYQFNNSLRLGGGFGYPSSSSVVYCTQSGVEYYDGGATELSFPSASEITTLNIGIYGATASNGLPFCGFFFHEDNLTATQLNAIRDHYLTIQP